MNSGPSKKPHISTLSILIIWLAAGLFLSLLARPAAAGLQAPPGRGDINVALDAGHGGMDTGAKGPTGSLEKTVTLELARKLAVQLEARYQVTLTRSDDYQLPLRQRAAIANQAKSDLFVSLHTGAAYLHSVRGMAIYYHSPVRRPGPPEAVRQDGGSAPLRWRYIQTRHTAASRRFAEALKEALVNKGTVSDCRILSAPLPVLEGADMPAVLVEVGPITNPAAESSMLSPQGLDVLARAISRAIEGYLDQAAGGTDPQ